MVSSVLQGGFFLPTRDKHKMLECFNNCSPVKTVLTVLTHFNTFGTFNSFNCFNSFKITVLTVCTFNTSLSLAELRQATIDDVTAV